MNTIGKIIGIYPGQFQPPHRGHLAAYKRLQQYSRENTFVITTDYDPTINAPLHFGDKEQILTRLGIPSNRIKKVTKLIDPETHKFIQPEEILRDFDEKTTTVIYALQSPVTKNLLRYSDYYKNVTGVGGKYEPYKKHSYIFTIDDSKIDGKIVTSDKIREALGSHKWTREQKEEFFKYFFGWFDLGLFELLKNKYTNAQQSDVQVIPPEGGQEVFPGSPENIREILSKEIVNILNELMGLPPSIATDPSYGANNSIATNDTPLNQQTADKEKKIDLVKQKKQAEDDKKRNLTQYKRDKDSVHNYDKYARKQDQEKVDALNKQITQTSAPTSTLT